MLVSRNGNQTQQSEISEFGAFSLNKSWVSLNGNQVSQSKKKGSYDVIGH